MTVYFILRQPIQSSCWMAWMTNCSRAPVCLPYLPYCYEYNIYYDLIFAPCNRMSILCMARWYTRYKSYVWYRTTTATAAVVAVVVALYPVHTRPCKIWVHIPWHWNIPLFRKNSISKHAEWTWSQYHAPLECSSLDTLDARNFYGYTWYLCVACRMVFLIDWEF